MTNSLPMDNLRIIDKIDQAKDSVGVITQSSLKDELGKFTPADWKQAAAIFNKDATTPDGFYINDDANGNVTIHNDMTKAHKLADNSVLSATIDDAKGVGEFALGTEGIIASSAFLTGAGTAWAEAGAGSGVGLFSSTVLGAGAALAGEVALGVAAASVVIGGAVVAGDYVDNYFRKGTAQDDIKNASVVNLKATSS